jgi:hypothetical protein
LLNERQRLAKVANSEGPFDAPGLVALWFCAYLVANGTITWLPTLYRQTFRLPLETSLPYGFLTPLAGVVAAVIRALLIDMISCKHWYMLAFLAATLPLTVLARPRRHGSDTRKARPC